MSVESVVAHLKEREQDAVGRLVEWLSIPSIGTDPEFNAETRRAAEWARDRLREIGVDSELHETGSAAKPGHPIVWAHHPGPDSYDGPHVLFYGHYDVQPPDPIELWESPPFEPALHPAIPDGPGERVVARGAVDDKGQVATFLEALRAWKEAHGEVPFKVSILIEGEEESGSANLTQYLHDNADTLRQADFCLISDTGMLGRGKPAITYGVRGLVYTEVILHAADQDLHSGLWGGRCPNPISELTRVLSRLWDEDRRVTLPGFYDGVGQLPQTQRDAWNNLGIDSLASLAEIGLGPEANVGEDGFSAVEREWARPTCDVNGIWGGYQGAGAKTVIPAYAGAKVSFRLVDDQDPAVIVETFRRWLDEHTPPGCRWEFHDHSGGPPATADINARYVQSALRALKLAGGVEPALIKSGGSIPVVGLLKSILDLDTVLMGFGLEDDRVHSPNEKFELDCFRLGMNSHARLIAEFAGLE